MDLMRKLTILADSAKYDAACTSSGAQSRRAAGRGMGSTVACGICHSFAADGRCISLLKVLLSNHCVYDCQYCINRSGNDVERAAFTPRELAELTLEFYRRNYIEGLFLSSGVLKSPDHTMEQMIRAIELLRHEHGFAGYIHAKTIPGASPALVERLGLLVDRLSVNIELPSEQSLTLLAPNKTKAAILAPMAQIRSGQEANRHELARYRHAPRFAPAGQATQMIVGATPESDYQIVRLAAGLYGKYGLKRVFYSAYIPVAENRMLPALSTKPPLLREHRLYQADFLLRMYRFPVEDILTPDAPFLHPYLDPKCNWALHHLQFFPVDVNAAPLETLLRVPGIGPTSAPRIVTARRSGHLTLAALKRLGVVLKRAQYFIRAADLPRGFAASRETILRALLDPAAFSFGAEQLSLFDARPGLEALPPAKEMGAANPGAKEAIACLAASL